jgi:Flp pilus assembly protein TadB
LAEEERRRQRAIQERHAQDKELKILKHKAKEQEGKIRGRIIRGVCYYYFVVFVVVSVIVCVIVSVYVSVYVIVIVIVIVSVCDSVCLCKDKELKILKHKAKEQEGKIRGRIVRGVCLCMLVGVCVGVCACACVCVCVCVC